MPQVDTDLMGKTLTLDVCRKCACVWFDPSEFQPMLLGASPAPQTSPPYAPKSINEAEQQIVIERVRRQAHEYNATPGDYTWHWLVGLCGMPVELDAPIPARRTLATWLLLATCIILSAVILGFSYVDDAETIFSFWGFVPARWWQLGGLTVITSFFAHGGILHLITNMYFLFVFGDNVEDRLGVKKYLLLVASAHLAGVTLHGLFSPEKMVPCVGASAGIAGIIAFYAVAFPDVRLGFLFIIYFYPKWIRIKAIWALGIYLVLQLIGAHYQVRGFADVSYLGHLGGLAVGITAALYMRASVTNGRKTRYAVPPSA
jgi:membrane associated rhomboid family serine protease